MLDDLHFIHEHDPQDALGVALKQAEQLTHGFEIEPLEFKPANIVWAGMGGSALGALLSTTWPGYKVPFEIVRTYDIPAYMGPETLFVASSFSGNTEETIEALANAEKTGARIAVVAGGGTLVDTARDKGYPLALLPKVSQPRYACPAFMAAIVALFGSLDVFKAEVTADALARTAGFLQEQLAQWQPDVPAAQNPAKQLAQELAGKSPVVYAGPLMYPAAYKWKISFNENAKNVAWCNAYPEFNHNEFIGWSSHPVEKPYEVINLMSSLEHPRIAKRFEISERLLSGQKPAGHTVQAAGANLAEQLLSTVAMGDVVSIYLALLNGVNPTPVGLVEKLKDELKK